MNKQELIDEIAMDANLSKADAGRAIEGFIKAIVKTLRKGEQAVLVGFGTFRVRDRAARKGRNPQTGQEIQIRATKVAGFTAGKGLKDALNGERAK